MHLVSLFDLHYHLTGSAAPTPTAVNAGSPRWVDSGVYETGAPAEPWDLDAPEARRPWSADLYVETANSCVRPGDVVVSLDDYSLPVADQITTGWRMFDRITVPDILRCLLLHPRGVMPEDVVAAIAKTAADTDIVGVTEKDIGPPWYAATSYIRRLRTALDDAFSHYVPIHVFGCFDPMTIPYLFFAGADVFDGLAWMRYFFRDGHAHHAKEYEYTLRPTALLRPREVARALLAHNVEELERLRADLRYAALTGDVTQFEECLNAMQPFDKLK